MALFQHVSLDRAMLAEGDELLPWTTLIAANPAIALSLDAAGISSPGLTIDYEGKIASDLEPAQDNAYWLGKVNNWQGVALKDTLSATPGGVSGDSLLFVDTDGKIKVRHGTGTPISLEEQGSVYTHPSRWHYVPITPNYVWNGTTSVGSQWITVTSYGIPSGSYGAACWIRIKRKNVAGGANAYIGYSSGASYYQMGVECDGYAGAAGFCAGICRVTNNSIYLTLTSSADTYFTLCFTGYFI